jgi:ribose transport system ATP-binding protein
VGPPALLIRDLSKSFGGARALKGVSLTVGAREIHGLLGQNGSGKSTLVKILAGFHAPDPGGRVEISGAPVALPLGAAELSRRGLAFVHQNLGLVPTLTVLENLRIGSLTGGNRWRIDWRRELELARAALERFAIDLDPRARLDSLSQVDRARLAIVRAFESLRARRTDGHSSGLLVLDEPTPFLPRQGVDQLFGLVRSVVTEGASVVFISHDLDEIREITDAATVLRDGEVSGTFRTAATSREALIEHIVGRKITRYRTGERRLPDAPPAARIRGLCGPRVREFSLDLKPGEIVGLTGLVGAGYGEVLHHLFGALSPATGGASAGEIEIGSDTLKLAALDPKRALAAGIMLLPGDRQNASGIGSLSVLDNLFLPDVARFFRGGRLRRGPMRRAAAELIATYDVRPGDASMPLSQLSGGNAQKVLLAKWLKLGPRLLLLDEPTQGVDVGARQQLLGAVRAAADAGACVLCASSDHEQLADLCDRVLVLARGELVAELRGAELTKAHIGERCYGAVPPPEALHDVRET